MTVFQGISSALLVAVIIQLGCQAFKVVLYSIKHRALEWKFFFRAGGMPSSHSAFVTALAVAIGRGSGFDTDLFALAFVFAAVIIYDSIRLRGAVQKHSEAIEKLVKLLPDSERGEVPKWVGHTFPEIVAGVVVGAVLAYLAYYLF
jgi:acid phosphatase family membrane protein YuiD